MSSWAEWVDGECQVIADAGRWRAPRAFDAFGAVGAVGDLGPPVVSFASNDYLGLTAHPGAIAAAHAALDRWGAGAGAARLVTGARPVHDELEAELAAWKGTESAVLFPTGFAANLSVVEVFGAAGVWILSDELNHASIIDGCRSARGTVRVFRHNDLASLDAVWDEAVDAGAERVVVISDTVYSMDGDVADVAGLAARCAARGGLLIVDEAHAVLGPELPDDAVEGGFVLRVGTLSKTLGSLGGFVAGPRRACELLVNRARPYIFTTASTPADTAAALANLRVLRSAEGDALVARLQANVERVRRGHPSPIVPIVIGPEAETVAASAKLLDRGLLVPAIRPPTVAPGASRLRVALSAAHTDEQLDALLAALDDLGLDPSDGG